MTEWYSDHVDRILKRKFIVLLFCTVLCAVSGAGSLWLDFDDSYKNYFSADNPEFVAFESIKARYEGTDNILFAIQPDQDSVFDPQVLATVVDLTKKAWHLPHAYRVDSLTNFQHTIAANDEMTVFELIRDPETLHPKQLEDIRRVAIHEPQLVNRLVSSDGDIAAVNVTLRVEDDVQSSLLKSVSAARALAAQIENASGYRVYLTGSAVYDEAFMEASMTDISYLVPVMYVVILITALVLLQSLLATLALFIVIVATLLVSMGIAGWMGMHFSTPSAGAPTIILTLAVADSIHIFTAMFAAMANGDDRIAAIRKSMMMNIVPIFVSSLTTAIGFLSLNFSDVPPFHDLGNMTALGVFTAFLFSITLLPVLLAIFPITVKSSNTLLGMLSQWYGFISKRAGILIVLCLFIMTSLLIQVPRLNLDENFLEYFDESIRFRSETEYITNNLTGLYYIDYSFESRTDQPVTDQALLEKIDAFEQWLQNDTAVVHVDSITHTLKRLNKSLHNDDDAYLRLPDRSEAVAQYLLFYELSLPYGLNLANRITSNKLATRVTVTLKNLSSKNIKAFDKRAHEWLAPNIPDWVNVYSGSPSLMYAHITNRNVTAMLKGTFIAVLFVGMTLLFVLRSYKLSLLSVLMNLAPALMALGTWSLFVGAVGLVAATVTTITLGIVVDDTVHFLYKYLWSRRQCNTSPREAVEFAINTVGQAIIVTSVILGAGFLVLALSVFEVNASLGILAAISIAYALLIDLVLLPAVMLKTDQST